MDDNTLTMTMLLDFYGELLTEKQRLYFDMYYNEDLSLSEIAENEGISRQGVRDFIFRAETILRQTEEKTGLIGRFEEHKEVVSGMENDMKELLSLTEGRARELAEGLYGRLQNLKDG